MNDDILHIIDMSTHWCMTKYINLNEIFTDYKKSKKDTIGMVFISLNTYMGTLVKTLGDRTLDNKSVPYIAASIIRLASHYRFYLYNKYGVRAHLFMYYKSEVDTTQHINGEFTDFLKRMMMESETAEENISIILDAIKMVSDIIRYVPDAYVIPATECPVSLIPSYVINKHIEHIIDSGNMPKLTESYSYLKIILLTKDILEEQLFCSLRFYDIESCILSPGSTPKTALQSMHQNIFGRKNKLSPDEVLLTSYPIFLALMGGDRTPSKSNIPSYFRPRSKTKLLEYARASVLPLNMNREIDKVTFDQYLKPLLKDGLTVEDVNERLKLFSMPLLYEEKAYIIDQLVDVWKVNLRDYSSFESLNELYFKDNPIDVNKLMCSQLF